MSFVCDHAPKSSVVAWTPELLLLDTPVYSDHDKEAALQTAYRQIAAASAALICTTCAATTRPWLCTHRAKCTPRLTDRVARRLAPFYVL